MKRFQGSTFDTIARRRFFEDQDTILEFTGKIQEVQNESNCMNDSRDFQDAESTRSGNFHVASRPVSFPPQPIPGGMLSPSFRVLSRREGPPSIWDTHGISGNVFANPDASSSAPYPQELNPWSSSIEEPLHTSTVEKSERPESKTIFRNISVTVLIKGRGAWQEEEEETRKDFSIVLILHVRALQGHSGRNLIDPSLQDHVVILSKFFQQLNHIGCAFNLHSIINSGLIPGGQNSSKRQTEFFLPIDPRDKRHQDPAKIDFNEPCHAQYMHKAWKRHQDAVYWVDIDLAIRKGLTFYQTRSKCNHPSRDTSSLLYPESCSDRNWRSHIRESTCVASASSKDFLET